MEIWYTPERIKLQQEVAERRMRRYVRRERRRAAEERRERRVEKATRLLELAVGAAALYGTLFAGVLWATM